VLVGIRYLQDMPTRIPLCREAPDRVSHLACYPHLMLTGHRYHRHIRVPHMIPDASIPDVTHQWFENGIAIRCAMEATAVRSNVNSDDAARYTVRVTNAYGRTTSIPAAVGRIRQTTSWMPRIAH
jgi:hypothetical protein